MPYQTFTSQRATWPDEASLQAQLRAALDPTVGFFINRDTRVITVKKNSAWTQPQITSAQSVIDAAPAQTPQTLAQAQITQWAAGGSPEAIVLKAIVLALVDKINDIDANLVAALAAINVLNTKTSTAQTTLPQPTNQINPSQALNAVLNKAGTL